MSEFLEFVLKSIVDSPESVKVVRTDGEGRFVSLTISVSQTDMGKVIGKGGKIIKSIRDLTRILATKENCKVNVILAD